MRAECDAPGARGAKVAMSHGINTKVVRCRRKLAHEGIAAAVVARGEFAQVTLEPAAASNVLEAGAVMHRCLP